MGNFVLMIETRAAKTGVKGKLAVCAFMMLRAKSPRPLMRFSEKSSGTTCLMFPTLTLLTIPVIDLRSASQERRWYSALLWSCAAAAWSARSRAGGKYTPPEREDVSLANSAIASNSLSFVSPFLPSAFSSSTAAMRAASWRSRSALRAGSTSSTRGASTIPRGGGGERDLRRIEGGPLSGERERDLRNFCVRTVVGPNAKRNGAVPFPLLRCGIHWWSMGRYGCRHPGILILVDVVVKVVLSHAVQFCEPAD